ncbi:MAG: pyridoxal phosphate-dependent aminotransferase [Clostridiales bacterium]|jgi:cystathionine beta-lyase|nr:pyridoxal phosphate-dependent aminotransferase [Clostridiales bacterium]
MHIYNFDKVVDRRNTGSLKYDCAAERGMPDGLIPLWVADMDFPTADEIVRELTDRAAHGIFGYSEPYREYFGVLRSWISEYFCADVEKEWLIQTPGIVFALANAVKAFTKENEAVIIQPPVYYPFSEITRVNGRRLIVNNLVNKDGVYGIDFEDFEKKIVENDVKLFLLCNPHNPVGRVWTEDELTRLGGICLRNNVVAVSDEIHANFVYKGHKHVSFLSFPEFFPISAVCTSPGKTFNLAGLQLSDIFVPDPVLRGKFLAEHRKSGYSQLNSFAHAGALAAYKFGGEWLRQLLAYLEKNRGFMKKYIDENIPAIKMHPPEGTYLAWLDFNGSGISYCKRRNAVVDKAGLWLDKGEIFGEAGAGFERLNFACPRSVLEKALIRLKDGIEKLK